MKTITAIGQRYAITEKTNNTKVSDLKTWEQICSYIKRDPKFIPSFIEADEIDKKSLIANFKLIICVRVRNEGWVPDFANSKQEKWYNWYRYNASRGCFVIIGTGAGYGNAVTFVGTGVGARFCFPTEGRAKTFAVDFADLYNDLFFLEIPKKKTVKKTKKCKRKKLKKSLGKS